MKVMINQTGVVGMMNKVLDKPCIFPYISIITFLKGKLTWKTKKKYHYINVR